MVTHKLLCYYVMNDGFVNEDKDIFEIPDMHMQHHLKPLFIRAKVEHIGINEVLIDCGACINMMPHSLLRKIGKYDTYLKSNEMVLLNYKGKTSRHLGAIQVHVVIGTATQPSLFMVIPTKANYKLLLV